MIEMAEQNPKDNRFKLARQMGIAITIPMVLLAGPLVGWFIGSWLDKKFGTSPWLTYIVLILGVVAGVRQAILYIKEISKNSDDRS